MSLEIGGTITGDANALSAELVLLKQMFERSGVGNGTFAEMERAMGIRCGGGRISCNDVLPWAAKCGLGALRLHVREVSLCSFRRRRLDHLQNAFLFLVSSLGKLLGGKKPSPESLRYVLT